MFPALSLLTTLLLVISIAASPVEVRAPRVTLPLAKRVNANGAATNVVQHDQARIAAFKQRYGGAAVPSDKLAGRALGLSPQSTKNVTNQATAFMASVGVGVPPTYYNLIIDTGSSNTWVGADKPYTPTSPSKKLGGPMKVSYGMQSFSGETWMDTVTLGPTLVGPLQSIGVANSTKGYAPGVDGVLGLGPFSLSIGTLTDTPSGGLGSVTEVMYLDVATGSAVVSTFFASATSDNNTNGTSGELTFGGVDSTKYNGDLVYTPITMTSPASNFWGIDLSITYGSNSILSQTAGIIDTGSTLILIASDAYDAYKQVTGTTEDEATGLLKLTASQYNNLQNLNFNVYFRTYSLTPNAQIWPRSLNSYIGGSNGAIYSIVSSTRAPSGQGLDFSLGQTFVERFYCVFDTNLWQVGFATTNYTNATTN